MDDKERELWVALEVARYNFKTSTVDVLEAALRLQKYWTSRKEEIKRLNEMWEEEKE